MTGAARKLSLPRHVYHLAEAANWPAIQRQGLLPAAELIGRSGLSKSDGDRLASSRRSGHTVLPGGAEIRDQKPMRDEDLRKCLIGMSPPEWYALLNARVFFWLDPSKVNSQHQACNDRPQVVLTIDADELVADYGDRAFISPINTGNTRRRPAPRGAATFVPYAAWVESGWASEALALGIDEKTRTRRPVELTITGAIPNAARYVIEVTHLALGTRFSPVG